VTAIKFEDNVQWDGKCIIVWAYTERGRVECRIPRDTIHAIPRFSDAISREIVQDRNEIVERLRSLLIVKIAACEQSKIVLQPQDLKLE